MRFTIAIGAAAAALVFTGWSVRAESAKSKTVKGSAPAAFGNADAISEDELRTYLYFLASDQLEGRNFPSRGYDIAALYVASHLAEWGLKPGGSTSGTNGPLQPYLMPIELEAKQVIPEDSKASLTAPPAGGRGGAGAGEPASGARAGEPRTTSYEYGKDWVAGAPAAGFAGGGGRGAAPVEPFDVSGKLVFAGNGYVIHKTKVNPYEGQDVKGKIIVVAGLPPELANLGGGRGGRGRGGDAGAAQGNPPAPADQPAGRGAANPLGEACTDYLTPEQYAARNGAAAVVTLANFQQLAAMSGRTPPPALNGPNFQVVKFRNTGACPSAPSITAGVELINAIFQGERINGSQVFYRAGNNIKLDSFELNSRKTLSLRVAARTLPGHSENVIGILEGGDPALKNEYVVMSAHLDHTGLSQPLPDGHNVNNGADDDGSGSTGLLAMAHAFAQGAAKGMRPKRSILFLWNGGEEKGLLGSRYFTQFPPIDLTKVVADLNMDMIGRSKNERSVDPNATHLLVKPGEVLLIGPEISSDDLERTIESVNGSYQKMTLNHFYDATAPDATHDNLGPPPRGQRVFYRSDHYNFAKVGVPIAFFTTGLHVDYHRPTDTPEKIDYREMQQISRLVAAVGWELANQDARPKLKEKLPEDLLKDMLQAKEQGWGKLTPVQAALPGEPY